MGDELRCDRLRKDDPSRHCRKLIAKANRYGQIAGNFLCERCKEEIEVRMVQAPAASKIATSDLQQVPPRFEKPTSSEVSQ